MRNKELLFVGGMFPKEEHSEIIANSKGHIQNAANELQWKLIDGFSQVFPGKVTLLTEPFVGGYPKHYRKLFVPNRQYICENGVDIIQRWFCNISAYKLYSIYSSEKATIKRWIVNHSDAEIYIAFYSIQIYHLWLASYISKRYPDVHLHIIVPDLPEYMGGTLTQRSLRGLLKQYHISLCQRNIDLFSSYTLLTAAMSEALGINKKACAIVEGIARISGERIAVKRLPSAKKTILYTGTLTRKYGVMNLVKAFMLIENPEYELVICGEGETKAEIVAATQMDSRIRYLGQVDSSVSIELQQNATLLVNPRQNSEEYTKYSFPSKLLEYLASGVPVLCYKLDGIPAEYDEFLRYIPDNTQKTFADEMKKICELSDVEREHIGGKAKQFVQNKKNAVSQVDIIVDIMLQRK